MANAKAGRSISKFVDSAFCVGSSLKANYLLAYLKSFAWLAGTPRRGYLMRLASLGGGGREEKKGLFICR